MENRLLDQFNTVITSQWNSQEITENYMPLSHRELFSIAYHTCNDLNLRCISTKLSQEDNKGGSKVIFYSNNKTFTSIETLDDILKIIVYFNEGDGTKLVNEIQPTLIASKEKLVSKSDDIKSQILKIILVERKIDETSNLVMLKEIARKVYFAIGDARETAAVVPMFMEAEGASLVQLALNKWMQHAQTLQQEKQYPETHIAGILKNLMQIKKWILNLVNINLNK